MNVLLWLLQVLAALMRPIGRVALTLVAGF